MLIQCDLDWELSHSSRIGMEYPDQHSYTGTVYSDAHRSNTVTVYSDSVLLYCRLCNQTKRSYKTQSNQTQHSHTDTVYSDWSFLYWYSVFRLSTLILTQCIHDWALLYWHSIFRLIVLILTQLIQTSSSDTNTDTANSDPIGVRCRPPAP